MILTENFKWKVLSFKRIGSTNLNENDLFFYEMYKFEK